MSYDYGFNFDSNAAGTQEAIVSAATMYPTVVTINGVSVTCGWVATGPTDFGIDNGTYDPRLRGFVYCANAAPTQFVFRVDLPNANPFVLHMANGTSQFSNNNWYVQVRDGVGALLTLDFAAVTLAPNQYYDAAGNLLDQTTWPSSEVGVLLTPATSSIFVAIGHPTNTGSFSGLNHFRLVQSSAPVPPNGATPQKIRRGMPPTQRAA